MREIVSQLEISPIIPFFVTLFRIALSSRALDDLAKTAEILARPILYTHTDTQHTFYIIDDRTTYTHATQSTNKE